MSQGSEKKTMRVLWLMCLLLLFTHSCSSSPAGETKRGCKDWVPFRDKDICCNACHPGNRLFSRCGQDPKDLCTPCENDTYTVQPAKPFCLKCTQCVGAQILVKQCTKSSDTVCGCKPGWKCGDGKCNFCVQECREGQEPTDKRSCRDCPEGTFNDQIHQKCKPWRKSCLDPKATILNKGDAFNNIKCSGTPENNSTPSITTLQSQQKPTDHSGDATTALIVTIAVLITIILIIASAVIRKSIQKKNKHLEKTYIAQVITTPTTDEPRTLRSEPGEYSYHPPQQEHGSSSESLATSQTSKDPLLV